MGTKDGVGIVEGGCVYHTEGATGDVHRPHALQLLVPVHGVLSANVDGVEVTIPNNNAMVIVPDTPRRVHSEVLRVSMLFDPEGLGTPFGSFARSATTTVLSGAVGKRLHALARHVCETSKINANTVRTVLAEGREILRHTVLTRDTNIDRRVRSAIDLYRRPWLQLDHPRIARRSGISPDHLSHLFKKQVGISAKRYALWVRTVAALERVFAGASASRAAKQVGFADVAHFSRACNRHFGHSPSRLPFGQSTESSCSVERSRALWSVALGERLDDGHIAH